MTALTLHKLHATGNDFLVVVALDGPDPVTPVLAQRLCDRHRGIGADGIMTVGPPRTPGSDCAMTLRNADGTIAQMSGNGIRCLARVADDAGCGANDRLVVDTDAGPRELVLRRSPDGAVAWAEVDMGAPTFVPAEIPVAAESPLDLDCSVDELSLRGDAVGMGNPHLVVPVADPTTFDLARVGPRLEHDARFPERTNVEIVGPVARDRLRMRVWERGVGETLSCGTGACAAAAAAYRRGVIDDTVVMEVPGGELMVRLGPTITLGGPVTATFSTVIDPARWA